MVSTQIQLPTTDIAWGIDRYEHSKDKGELVVPVIYLWKSPACVAAKDNLTGAVEHGTELTVTKRKQRDDRYYYFATCNVEYEGELYRQEGWLSGMMLFALGAEEHVRDNGVHS